MGKLNVYNLENELVAILKNAADETVLMNSKGKVIKIPTRPYPTHILSETRLLDGAEYSEKFIQAAIGGLSKLPSKVKTGRVVYFGNDANLTVEHTGDKLVKVAIGIPAEAYIHTESEEYKNTKRNKGTTPDLNIVPPSEKKVENDMDNDLIPIVGDDEEYANVPRLIIEWKNVKSINVDDIQAFFDEHQDDFLGIPSSIKIDTGKETIVKRQKGSSLETKKIEKKSEYYGLTPTMERICKQCQCLNFIETDKKTEIVTVKCESCGYHYTYEGSLPGQGISGQGDIK